MPSPASDSMGVLATGSRAHPLPCSAARDHRYMKRCHRLGWIDAMLVDFCLVTNDVHPRDALVSIDVPVIGDLSAAQGSSPSEKAVPICALIAVPDSETSSSLRKSGTEKRSDAKARCQQIRGMVRESISTAPHTGPSHIPTTGLAVFRYATEPGADHALVPALSYHL